MLSTIHSHTLARAQPLSRFRRSSFASIPVIWSCHDDRGRASRSTGAFTLPSNGITSLLNGNRLQPRPASGLQRHHSSLSRNDLSISQSQREPYAQMASGCLCQRTIRTNFSYAGPRKLSDIIKTELLTDKSAVEISNLWMNYHEGKERVHGLTLDQAKGKSVSSRAVRCPFFVHPVFREGGYFMIISQFQGPNFFLLTFLEDYRKDPARAQPLLTLSVFDDLAEGKGVTLVRCDIINQGINEDEGYKICKWLLDDYSNDNNFRDVHMFNKQPNAFDVEMYLKKKERRWKVCSEEGNAADGVIESAAEKKSDSTV